MLLCGLHLHISRFIISPLLPLLLFVALLLLLISLFHFFLFVAPPGMRGAAAEAGAMLVHCWRSGRRRCRRRRPWQKVSQDQSLTIFLCRRCSYETYWLDFLCYVSHIATFSYPHWLADMLLLSCSCLFSLSNIIAGWCFLSFSLQLPMHVLF